MITERVALLLRKQSHAPIEVVRTREVEHGIPELLGRVDLDLYINVNSF